MRLSGGGCEADERRVEILNRFAPKVVDGAVAFVDGDEVEEFGWDFGIVDDVERVFGSELALVRVLLFQAFVEGLVFKDGVHALDGTDADLAAPGDERGLEALDVVELGEFAVVVVGDAGHELLFGLFA